MPLAARTVWLMECRVSSISASGILLRQRTVALLTLARREPAVFLNVNKRDVNAGIFGQQEWSLGTHWKPDLGARFDWSHYRRSAVSPRGALIFQPDANTSYKFMVGRGFRNPSPYEMFFEDGVASQANPNLLPATAMTYEFTVSTGSRPACTAWSRRTDTMIDDRVSVSAGLQYAGERRTCAGAVIPWMLIPEAALNARKLAASFEVSLVARNLGNQRLFDPIALSPRVDTVPLAGRTFLLSIVWRSTGR